MFLELEVSTTILHICMMLFFFFSPLLDLTSIHRGCPVNRIVSQNAVLLLWIEVSIEM